MMKIEKQMKNTIILTTPQMDFIQSNPLEYN